MNMSPTGEAEVFLGAPSILTAPQQTRLEQWVAWLEGESFRVRRLNRDCHGEDPWHTLTEVLCQADGVVLLGFRQLDARRSVWRPGTEEEAPSSTWWTSPWLQLEAGIAVGLSLPVLVVPEDGVTEGVFDPAGWTGQVTGTALHTPGAGAGPWSDAVRRSRLLRADGGTRERRSHVADGGQ
ncbi:hypothetical protein GCM10010378_35520 [Streptomyces viridochromogenes]